MLYHSSKRTGAFLECNGILILKLPRNLPERNSIDNVIIMEKEIASQIPCLKEEMRKQECKA